MSDGMSDAKALEKLGGDVQSAAVDLADAINAASTGHRGMSLDAIRLANETLKVFDLRLEKIYK